MISDLLRSGLPGTILNKLNIRIADSNDMEAWDEYVQSHPDVSPYHLFAWKRAVEKAYGHRAYYFVAEAEGRITGVLPIFYLKPPFFPGQLVSLPFCDVGDILADDENIKNILISAAVSMGKKLKARNIELRGQRGSFFEDTGMHVHVQSHKVRMLFNLPQSSELLWDSFKSKLRSQIRRAEKNDLVFKWGGASDVPEFYSVFSRNMRDLGSPVHSREWFHSILRYYDVNARMGMVYHNKQLVGTGIILTVNNLISIPWASTLREYNKLSPNMFLYWNFLKFAADNGYARFDFGRSTPNEGTYKFKAQWGAEPVPLCWQFITGNNEYVDTSSAPSSKREHAARLWQSLPLGIANCIGPAIRKHISL